MEAIVAAATFNYGYLQVSNYDVGAAMEVLT